MFIGYIKIHSKKNQFFVSSRKQPMVPLDKRLTMVNVTQKPSQYCISFSNSLLYEKILLF